MFSDQVEHACVCVSSRDRDRQPMSRGDVDRRERRPRPEESRSKRQVPSRDLPHEGTQTATDRRDMHYVDSINYVY